jgi:hypothetical protein
MKRSEHSSSARDDEGVPRGKSFTRIPGPLCAPAKSRELTFEFAVVEKRARKSRSGSR